MTTAAFEERLKSDGYVEIETKRLDPRPANGEHGHHFDVRGLVLEGAFIVTLEGVARTYGPGDVFEVAAGQLHFEEVGPDGTTVMVGRKY